jgi:phosphocarrier protein HPr
MESCRVRVVNVLGLHARAAAQFVRTAARYRSTIEVARGERRVDGKSILGLLMLAAARGVVLQITADGDDAGDAIAALCGLIERGFEDV